MEWFLRSRPRSVVPLWALLIGCFDIAGLRAGPMSVNTESLDIVKVSAVTGGDATLPCDSHTTQPKDVLLLVVWYKDDVPMYSFDGRVPGPQAHWADDSLGGRARWHSEIPSSLRIRNIIPSDRALYRCRVDFKVSPTLNQKVLLDVIELPEKPKIFDEYDKEIIGVAGPYVEDSSLKLTCVVSGGRPMPRLRWWRNDKVVNTLPPVNDGSKISMLELRISKLSREYFEAVYTCTADNTALVPPARVNVQIQIYLKPLSVEILTREQPLAVEQKANLSCRAIGARPPAVITWWLDHKQMTAAVQKDSSDRNETISTLRWVPQMEHNGKTLTCRAKHAVLEHTTLETSLVLNLHYAPIVELQLGSTMNPNDIEEDDDVYFECKVQSNPGVYKVIWEHDGQIMTHNQRAGVIAGTAHLVLQKVSRKQAGKYTCIASNVEGDGKSAPVHLQILYKPVCKTSSMSIIGAAINEPAKVICDVDAFPPPVSFQWSLNNSMGTVELDAKKIAVTDGKSILSFTPKAETDYGVIACRATNLAGQQIEPCRYTLLPAVRPDRPYNCSTFNVTEDSVELKCFAGYDGGLQTMYFVEAWESRMLVLNVSTPTPHWKLRGLGSGKTLKLVFYAHNARGRSEVTTLRIHTLSRLALQTEADTSIGVDMNWIMGIISGISLTFIVLIIFALIMRRRDQPIQYAAPMQTVKAYKDSVHGGNRSPLQPDDKNPDVVPLGKDLEYSRETERPPEPPPYQAVISPLVGLSRSAHSLHQQELRSTALTPNTPASDAQSIGTLAEDRRSVTSGTMSRRREVVTTRTPLLANTRESCV